MFMVVFFLEIPYSIFDALMSVLCWLIIAFSHISLYHCFFHSFAFAHLFTSYPLCLFTNPFPIFNFTTGKCCTNSLILVGFGLSRRSRSTSWQKAARSGAYSVIRQFMRALLASKLQVCDACKRTSSCITLLFSPHPLLIPCIHVKRSSRLTGSYFFKLKAKCAAGQHAGQGTPALRF